MFLKRRNGVVGVRGWRESYMLFYSFQIVWVLKQQPINHKIWRKNMFTVVISGRQTSRGLLFIMCHIPIMFQVWVISVCCFYDRKKKHDKRGISQRIKICSLTLLTTWSIRMESTRSLVQKSKKLCPDCTRESETAVPPYR